MMAAKLLTLAAMLLAPVAAHRATPIDDSTIAVLSTATYTAGSVVTISFSTDLKEGFVHATAGTFTASQFSTTASASAAACTGTNQIIYKGAPASTTNDITWTAPSNVDALPSVTLSFAGAGGYGAIKRRMVDLTRGVATTTTTTAGVAGAGTTTTTTVAPLPFFPK